MEIYKYILLIMGSYIAICSIFSKTFAKFPICFENIFGRKISIITRYVVAFGILYWIFDSLNKRFFAKIEGWMSIADIKKSTDKDINVSLIPADVKDIPEVACPGDEVLSPSEKEQLAELKKKPKAQLSEVDKSRLERLESMVKQFQERRKSAKKIGRTTGEKDVNPNTGKCHGQFSDIPDGYYGYTIITREASDKTFKYDFYKTGKNIKAEGKVVREQKMRPISSVESDCKLKKDRDGNLTVERSLEAKSPNSDSTKCVNSINIVKSKKDQKQYDANNLDSVRTNKELTPSEKEDKQKNKDFDVDINLVNPKPVYYEPGSYTFGASTYVPNYEQSVYLSKTTGLSQTAPLSLTPNNSGGFCESMKNDKMGLDKKCQSLKPDVCPSTSCCVLLGGEKCFAGTESGPTNKSAFSDTTITNNDYYYYKSKCYGNCP
jgi:hypothetical protein